MTSIQQSPVRSETFTRHVKSAGIKVKGLYWTFGRYDSVLNFDAPDEEAAHAAILTLARAGNVQTQTLRAYDRSGIEPMLSQLV